MDNGLFGVFYFCLGVKLDKKLDQYAPLHLMLKSEG